MTIGATTIPLGKSTVRVSPLALGTWTWDSAGQFGPGRDYDEEGLRGAFTESLQSGITFIDTAEYYGNGGVETMLGRFIKDANADVVVAGKFPPFRNRFLKQHLLASLRGSLARMGLQRFDVYQTHFHFRFVPLRIWMSALADAFEEGLTRSVGLANYSAEQLRVAHRLLAHRGVPLASAQVEYSLLHRHPENNGIFDTCRELGITVLAYSPLAMGMLTGKYSSANPPPANRGQRYDSSYLERIKTLILLMRGIGEPHGGKTPAQVALNWVMRNGAIPIHGAKNGSQAKENAGALGWQLSDHEVEILSEASNLLQK